MVNDKRIIEDHISDDLNDECYSGYGENRGNMGHCRKNGFKTNKEL